LGRVLVKARVTNLEEVPRHIVFSEAEGFLGQSWTIQCEIISQQLLGAQPGDEDPTPDDNPLEQEPPFDFFGHGQPVQPGLLDQHRDEQLDNAQHEDQDWGQWLAGAPDAAPTANIEPLDLDLNIQAEDDAEEDQFMDLDLNVMPIQEPGLVANDIADLQAENSETDVTSISILAASLPSSRTVQGNLHEQVFSPERTAWAAMNEIPTMPLREGALGQNAQPILNNDGFFLPDDLLQAIDSPAIGDLVIPQVNLNLQVGIVLHQDSNMADPVFEKFTMSTGSQIQSSTDVELFRTWGRFFSPVGDPQKQISILLKWAPFFTCQLLKKDYFHWAYKFLNSLAWEVMQQEDSEANNLKFSLPLECPAKEALCYGPDNNHLLPNDPSEVVSLLTTPEIDDQASQQHSSTTDLLLRKRKQRQLVLIDSELRRSLRIKAYNTGFKSSRCGRKNCMGCELDPPTLSSKIIKNLGEKICKMDPIELSDAKLITSHTSNRAISKKKNSKAELARKNNRKAQVPSKKIVPNGGKASKESKDMKK
jgi:hypothetical protein